MKNQVKVSTTQKYSDSQGEHIVCEGKLVLVKDDKNYPKEGDLAYGKRHGNIFWLVKDYCDLRFSWEDVSKFGRIKPIIISETEEIEVGDKAYFAGEIITWSQADEDGYNKFAKKPPKILALPEQFSDKHLQAIVDGKMKEGKVLVKCWLYAGANYMEVHLDQQNHITLFPAQQSLEVKVPRELLQEWIDRLDSFEWDVNRQCLVKEDMEKFMSEWAVKNNYKGE